MRATVNVCRKLIIHIHTKFYPRALFFLHKKYTYMYVHFDGVVVRIWNIKYYAITKKKKKNTDVAGKY